MQKLSQLLGIAIVLSSCAPPNPTQYRHVDAALEPYVQRFEAVLGKPINFTVTLADIDHNYVGLCTVGGSSPAPGRYIQISSYYYPSRSDSDIEQVVFHELGHCELDRQHVNILDSNGYPISIMYYMEFGYMQWYTTNHSAYVAELFKNATDVYSIGNFGDTNSDFRHE